MKLCARRALLLCLFVFAFLAALPAASHADTYQILTSGPVSHGYLHFTPLGLTADGTLIEQYFNGDYPFVGSELACPSNSQVCYYGVSAANPFPFTNNGFTNATPCTPATGSIYSRCDPGIAFDNGAPCTVGIPGLPGGPGPSQKPGVCNNGHQVPFDQLFVDANGVLGYGPVSSGSLSGLQFFYPNSNFPNSLFVNAEGDIAFDEFRGNYSQDYLFIDLTSRLAATPEPSSFLLLGTGLAIAAGVLRTGVRRKH